MLQNSVYRTSVNNTKANTDQPLAALMHRSPVANNAAKAFSLFNILAKVGAANWGDACLVGS